MSFVTLTRGCLESTSGQGRAGAGGGGGLMPREPTMLKAGDSALPSSAMQVGRAGRHDQ